MSKISKTLFLIYLATRMKSAFAQVLSDTTLQYSDSEHLICVISEKKNLIITDTHLDNNGPLKFYTYYFSDFRLDSIKIKVDSTYWLAEMNKLGVATRITNNYYNIEVINLIENQYKRCNPKINFQRYTNNISNEIYFLYEYNCPKKHLSCITESNITNNESEFENSGIKILFNEGHVSLIKNYVDKTPSGVEIHFAKNGRIKWFAIAHGMTISHIRKRKELMRK